MKEPGRPGNPPKSVDARKSRATRFSGSPKGDHPVRSGKLEQFRERVLSAPDIRTDRVELIKRKIKKGTYNVKAEDIAERIIRSEDLSALFRSSKEPS